MFFPFFLPFILHNFISATVQFSVHVQLLSACSEVCAVIECDSLSLHFSLNIKGNFLSFAHYFMSCKLSRE